MPKKERNVKSETSRLSLFLYIKEYVLQRGSRYLAGSLRDELFMVDGVLKQKTDC